MPNLNFGRVILATKGLYESSIDVRDLNCKHRNVNNMISNFFRCTSSIIVFVVVILHLASFSSFTLHDRGHVIYVLLI